MFYRSTQLVYTVGLLVLRLTLKKFNQFDNAQLWYGDTGPLPEPQVRRTALAKAVMRQE